MKRLFRENTEEYQNHRSDKIFDNFKIEIQVRQVENIQIYIQKREFANKIIKKKNEHYHSHFERIKNSKKNFAQNKTRRN